MPWKRASSSALNASVGTRPERSSGFEAGLRFGGRAVLDWRSADANLRASSVYCDFEDVRKYKEAVPLARAAGVPVGLATVQTSYGALYAQQMAIAILGALPLLIAFLLFQRQIVQGIANTGLKG